MRPPMKRLLALLVGCSSPADCPPLPSSPPSTSTAAAPSGDAAHAEVREPLVFKEGGAERAAITAETLSITIAPEIVVQYDPYYNREKKFRALPLAAVLERGFKGVKDLPQQEFVLRAKDGFTVPLRGAKVFEKGAYLAIEDVEVAGWEPIGPRRANPGPFYLVWAGKDQTDLETHPRPYQLASIEIARFEDVFPRTVPASEAGPARRGFEVFREQCIHCHAINRQGGKVGPELNVPQSIVEYRPVDQIKAYIKNPRTFRYSQMPAHEAMTETDLDALIAYFTEMKGKKIDDPAP
jgi:mono/diheme cytochrome c family protein